MTPGHRSVSLAYIRVHSGVHCESELMYNGVCSPRIGGSSVIDPPAHAGNTRDSGSVLGLGRSLEKEMATCSHVLAWEIPWTEKLAGGPWGHKESDMTERPPSQYRIVTLS